MPFAGERAAAQDAHTRAEGRRQLLTLTPHERHKKLLEDYGACVSLRRVAARCVCASRD
jgi:hypothetical protein